ncbi:MAG: POTRA domain-containing protein, partial [Phocaeicola sp.]
KNAFPIKEGDILNIRRLEQGLEQMKRVSSSDVSMKLLPADNI